MRGVRKRGEAVVAGVLVVAALTACGGQTQQVLAPTTSTTSDPIQTSQSPTTQPPRPSATATATATATASRTTSAATPSPGPTRWPKALGEPAQGDRVWAVYLAVAHSSTDPLIDQALQAAASVGYTGITGDVACDQGALAALGLDEHDFWSAASLYFATKADADDFVASYQAEGSKVVGSAKINLGCLD